MDNYRPIKIFKIMSLRFLTIVLLCSYSSIFVFGQNVKTKDSLTVKIMVNKFVKSNDDLQAKVIVKNLSTAPVSVYKDLQFGDYIGSRLVFDRTKFYIDFLKKKRPISL